MSRPTAISPEEQEQLARQIGVLLLQEAPEDWQQITLEYRATGDHEDLLAEVTQQDGSLRSWEPPQGLVPVFQQLRAGMYRSDVGTWLSALYVVDRPASYRIDINFDTEPRWDQPIPDSAYAEEIARHPRAEENLPGWWRAKLQSSDNDPAGAPEGTGQLAGQVSGAAVPAGQGPAAETTARPQLVEVFDGHDEHGRPVVAERTPVRPDELEALRHYLENAPIVRPARDHGPDELDPQRSELVPLSWHTDGDWVWPGAVVYYLAHYGVPPQDAFVEHLRTRRFVLSGVDANAHEAAARLLMERVGPETPQTTTTAPVGAAPLGVNGVAASPEAAIKPVPETHDTAEPPSGATDDSAEQQPGEPMLFTHPDSAQLSYAGGPDGTPEKLADTPEPELGEAFAEPDSDPLTAPSAAAALEEPGVDEDLPGPVVDRPQPAAEDSGEVRPRTPAEENALTELSERLDQFDLDPDEYRIGSVREEAWCLVPEGAGWSVFRESDGDQLDQVRFDHVAQAGAYLLGSLLLSREDSRAESAAADSNDGPPARAAASDPAETAAPTAEPQRSAAQPADTGLTTSEAPNSLFIANQEPAPPSGDEATRFHRVPQAPSEQRNGTSLPQRPDRFANGPPTGQPGTERPAPRGDQPQQLDEPYARPGQQPGGVPHPPQHPGPPPAAPGGPMQPGAGADHRGGPPSGPRPPQQGEQPGYYAQPGGQSAGRPNGLKRPPHQPGPQAPQQQPHPSGPQPGQQAGQPGESPQVRGSDQQIQPLRGEPPLTLFRDRRQVVLPPGTEVDRFGEVGGNVTYAAGTPYAHRSLPPQWVNRNYYAYRVQRPVQVIYGTAVPWFEQAGGGTAYVLPGAIEDLLAEGTLIELTGDEAPPRPPME